MKITGVKFWLAFDWFFGSGSDWSLDIGLPTGTLDRMPRFEHLKRRDLSSCAVWLMEPFCVSSRSQ
jgi:hypothetical protein